MDRSLDMQAVYVVVTRNHVFCLVLFQVQVPPTGAVLTRSLEWHHLPPQEPVVVQLLQD